MLPRSFTPRIAKRPQTTGLHRIILWLLSISGTAPAILANSSEPPFTEAIFKTSEPLSIDGILDDWKLHPADILGCNSPLEKSASGIMRSGWDTEYLYFSCEVFDDQFYSRTNASPAARNQDCLELFIDTRGIDYYNRMPIARTDAMMTFDHFIISEGGQNIKILDDNDDEVLHSPNDWKIINPTLDEELYARTASETRNRIGAWLEFDFSGDQLQAVGVHNAAGGLCDVILDGVVIDRVDFFGRFTKPTRFGGTFVYDTGKLPPGKHRIRFQSVTPPRCGVTNLIILPNPSGPPILDFQTSDGTPSEGLEVVSTVGESKWTIEGKISWKSLGLSKPAIGTAIRFGYKIYDHDNSNDIEERSLGLRRHGSETTVDWMIINPDRFPKVILADHSTPQAAQIELTETVHNDEPWLDLTIKMPSIGLNWDENSDLTAQINVRGITESQPMRLSSGNRMLFASRAFLSDFDTTDTIGIEIRANEKPIANSVVEIPIAIRTAFERIERELPGTAIESCDPKRRPYVQFFKECARELAAFYSNQRNRDVMHYNHLPYFEDRKVLQRDIDVFVQHAKLWLSGEINDRLSRLYRLQVWNSKASNSWQPFKLRLPKDYNPDLSYPIVLKLHYDHKKVFSRTEWTLYEIDGHTELADNRVNKDGTIEIELFGRGNSFENLADEEIDYIYSWISETFPNNTGDIRMWGNSIGGYYAMLHASRNIDRVSLLDLSGAIVPMPIPKASGREYDFERSYLNRINSTLDKHRNFRNFPIKQMVGEKDYHELRTNKAFHEAVRNERFGYQIDVIEGAAHDIPWGKETALRINPAPRDSIPSSFELKQSRMRYGELFGVNAQSKVLPWRPFEFEARRIDQETLKIATVNLDSIHLDFTKLGTASLVRIDTSNLEIPPKAQRISASRGSADWTVDTGEPTDRYRKRPGLEGPIGEIEPEGFLIVYGTQKPASNIALFDRARRIADNLTGSDTGQWSGARFIVKADTEVTESEIQHRNLWLIGNIDENAIVSRMAPNLRFEITPQQIRIGEDVFESSDTMIEAITLNPLSLNTYIFIEAALAPSAYYAEQLKARDFDFAVRKVDHLKNDVLLKGVFDSRWGVGPGSKSWRSEASSSKQ